MAKSKDQQAEQTSQPAIDIHTVAARLFANAWRPRGGLSDWVVAVDAYRGAIALAKVGEAIASGYSPDDVVAEQQLQAEEIKT